LETRKLIKFGNASHVISIPGQWVKKNNLHKGDLIYFEENGSNELIISPEKKESKKEEKEITIVIEKQTLHTLQREIVSTYINDHKVIRIIGDNLSKYSVDIRELINNLVGLEIIEQTQNRIVANDFIDIEKISIVDIIRRVDITIRAMMSDAIRTSEKDLYESIYNRDQDVNRLTILIYRACKYFIEHKQESVGFGPTDYFRFWTVAENMERIGDEIKRSARFLRDIKLSKNKMTEIMGMYTKMEKYYLQIMNSFYKRNKELLLESGVNRDEIMKSLENFLNKNYAVKYVPNIVEKLKSIGNFGHSIVKTMIYN